MKPLVLLLIAGVFTSPLSAQDSSRMPEDSVVAPEHPYRSPRRALILGSLIPGAGHIYAGEYWHGIQHYEWTVSNIGMGAMVYVADGCMFSFLSMKKCDPGPQWPHQALGIAIAGVGVWGWVSSARDAARAAERTNERHRRKFARATPIIEAPAGSHGEWRTGVMIPW
jgi:hypothetical protein